MTGRKLDEHVASNTARHIILYQARSSNANASHDEMNRGNTMMGTTDPDVILMLEMWLLMMDASLVGLIWGLICGNTFCSSSKLECL
ncbi:hypothetical protein OGAPHI_000936 [Ogataea philodendri]|uniref:Uncharacterized protein n=1 Tax=Ogataea philodendri TaxID=1378263 RepID=A0A9P8PEK0_9ASCO|nr:uncharacterized protein OGAPHI_000936 [Ogataea philodendri]KAH3670421.1 hypothetical protein OGAPHI_000936 [Ogataea philodendri]